VLRDWRPDDIDVYWSVGCSRRNIFSIVFRAACPQPNRALPPSRTAALALTTARTSGSSAAAAQLQPNLSLAAVTAVPPQQTHGETKAISYYSWLLHGSHAVNVYYGSCSAWTQSCSTGGWWVFDHSANTLFSGDGTYFLEDARKGGGVTHG
jgi:hypothetical protein